jgi:putative membrane protein
MLYLCLQYRWRAPSILLMKKVATALVALVAIEHIYILVLEMFLWTKPAGLRAFGLSPAFAEQTAVLAANQGLYNGFLAAGLILGLARRDDGFPIRVFFLSCVIIAGIFGAITAKPSILIVQAAPALIALALTLVAHRQSQEQR